MAAIGLLFGSFNPVHHGHLLLATYIREAAQLDEIWFVVSPQNPFKKNSDLADENHRLEMVKLAVQHTSYFKVADIEFSLPKPSYTCTTLKELNRQYPAHKFHVIIGGDNTAKFQEWKESGWIQKNYTIIIYNRGIPDSAAAIQNSKFYSLPLLDISATEIRQRIKNKKSIRYFIPENVEQYIAFHKLYR
ncbi:MAG: nicotinate-nucleotide adenylyltransferase [Sphingobacteriales bacterium]|nr:nicotinate-nucleotide adenylyltransferase [Sphingobacteriales bacterium]